MEVFDLNNLDDFRRLVNDIRKKYGWHDLTDTRRIRNTILFRGQGNSEWPLVSTLERGAEKRFSILEYLFHAFRCASELESFTDKEWGIPEWSEVKKQVLESSTSTFVNLPNYIYSYLVYLRHHGFLSPLLDWTISPYIAAYFAYRFMDIGSKKVSIYIYIETPHGSKGGMVGNPQISGMGPYVKTHRRHFAQKSRYTICTKYDNDRGEHYFHSYEDFFKHNLPDQDIFLKINLPSKERHDAFEELSDYNINDFSLFQSEDSLVQTLSIKEFLP